MRSLRPRAKSVAGTLRVRAKYAHTFAHGTLQSITPVFADTEHHSVRSTPASASPRRLKREAKSLGTAVCGELTLVLQLLARFFSATGGYYGTLNHFGAAREIGVLARMAYEHV